MNRYPCLVPDPGNSGYYKIYTEQGYQKESFIFSRALEQLHLQVSIS